jgi:hypothetical protein
MTVRSDQLNRPDRQAQGLSSSGFLSPSFSYRTKISRFRKASFARHKKIPISHSFTWQSHPMRHHSYSAVAAKPQILRESLSRAHLIRHFYLTHFAQFKLSHSYTCRTSNLTWRFDGTIEERAREEFPMAGKSMNESAMGWKTQGFSGRFSRVFNKFLVWRFRKLFAFQL